LDNIQTARRFNIQVKEIEKDINLQQEFLTLSWINLFKVYPMLFSMVGSTDILQKMPTLKRCGPGWVH
jgi:hypothetical protein